jgi:hypothetical protein
VLIKVAVQAKRVSPFKRSHSPGAITALTSLAGGQIPQPDYVAPATDVLKGDAAVEAAGGTVFGEWEQNVEVERAAIKVTVHGPRMTTVQEWAGLGAVGSGPDEPPHWSLSDTALTGKSM